MARLRAILWRELSDHLQSLRFSIGLVLIVGLFVVSAVSWNIRYERESSAYQIAAGRAAWILVPSARPGGDNLALGGAEIWRPSSPLGFVAGGHDRSLPNHVRASEGGVRLEQRGDSNPLLVRRDLDWAFIIGFLGSLLALLLSHDAIAGEKETGTLRQTLANPVPRDTILLGKYLGIQATVTVPIVLGAALALLIMVLAGETEMSAHVCIPLVPAVLGGLVCVSAFTWLGLFVSSRTTNASLALMASLVVWSLFAVFLPSSGGLIGNRLVPVESHSDLQRDLKRIWRSRSENSGALVARAREHHRQQLLRQLEVAQAATQASPVAAFRYLGEAVSGTGVNHYRFFLSQVEDYRRLLLDFASELDSAPDVRARAEETPVFRFRESSMVERLDQATDSIIVLLAYNLLFFAGTYLSFRGYDIS